MLHTGRSPPWTPPGITDPKADYYLVESAKKSISKLYNDPPFCEYALRKAYQNASWDTPPNLLSRVTALPVLT
jgi:hypothetical protein